MYIYLYIYVYDVYVPILIAPNSRGILADGGASQNKCNFTHYIQDLTENQLYLEVLLCNIKRYVNKDRRRELTINLESP